MMRISIWSPNFELARGGIEALSADVVEACGREWEAKGVPVWTGAGRGVLAKLGFGLRCFLDGVIRRPRAVVLMHVHLVPLAALLKRIFGFRLAVWVHGIEVWDGPERREVNGLSEVDLFIAISEVTVARTACWRPPGTRCEIIHPTADFERFTPGPAREDLRARYGLPERQDVVLTVGRLASGEGYKGHDAVIRALPKVLERRPLTKYLIVGTGDDRKRLEKLAAELGLSDKVVFAGWVSGGELAGHYRLASVFAMPSGGEGFGIVYLEALGCGCRVVAGVGDGAADALGGGKFGWMVDPSDSQALVAGLLESLDAESSGISHAEINSLYGKARFAREVGLALEPLMRSCAG